MKRRFEYSNYEIKENDKRLKRFVGKDMIVTNKHLADLYFIQNAELEELKELEAGLLLKIVK